MLGTAGLVTFTFKFHFLSENIFGFDLVEIIKISNTLKKKISMIIHGQM